MSEAARRGLQSVLELTGATSGSVIMLDEAEPGVATLEVAATLEPCNELRVIPSGEIIASVGGKLLPRTLTAVPEKARPKKSNRQLRYLLQLGAR